MELADSQKLKNPDQNPHRIINPQPPGLVDRMQGTPTHRTSTRSSPFL
jgi:hypothetical protein